MRHPRTLAVAAVAAILSTVAVNAQRINTIPGPMSHVVTDTTKTPQPDTTKTPKPDTTKSPQPDTTKAPHQ